MRGDLPFVDFQLWPGLITKFRAEDSQGLQVSKNADGYGVFRAWGKVPGSTRKSNTAGGAIKSLHFFEYSALDNVETREVLALDSTGELHRIEADRSLTSLKTGMVGEPMSAVTMFDRLHLCSANNDPVKHDGNSVTRWGVLAPGEAKTSMESFDDNTAFSINGTNTKANSSTSKDGSGSVRLNKVDTTTALLRIERSGLSLDFSDAGSDQAFIYFFIPAGGISKLAASGTCFEVCLGSTGSFVDASHYRFSVGSLVEGWNLLTIDLGDPDAETGSGASLAAVGAVRVDITLGSAAFTQSGFLVDYLYKTDEPAPTAALGASGSGVDANSIASYRITFLSKYGQESNAGASSSSVTTGSMGNVVELTNLPISQDPQVIARRIYRDLDSDSLHQLIAQVDDNTTTTYSDSIPNASRASNTPPLAGDSLKDNRAAPKMKAVVEWQGHIIGINAETPYTIEISNLNAPEGFPLVQRQELEKPIEALLPTTQGIFLLGSDITYILTGEVLSDFRFDKIKPDTGAPGFRAVAVENNMPLVLNEKGPALVSTHQTVPIGLQVQDIFDGLDGDALADAHVVNFHGRFMTVFFLQSQENGAYDTVLCHQYGGAGLALDPSNGTWTQLVLPASVDPTCSAIVDRDADRQELWIGTSAGIAYRLFDPERSNWAVGSLDEAIDCQVETAWASLGKGPDAVGRPRYLSVNIDAPTQTVWTATVTTADAPNGKQLGTSTFTFTAGPNKTSHLVPVPGDLVGQFAKVKLSNVTDGGVGTIKALRLYYADRGFRGPRG